LNTYSTGTLVSVPVTFKNAGTLYDPVTLYAAYIIQPFNKNTPWTAPVVSLFGAMGQPFSIVKLDTGSYVLEIPTPLQGIYVCSVSDMLPDNFTGIFHDFHQFQAKTPPV
jgi:hypothetical protein